MASSAEADKNVLADAARTSAKNNRDKIEQLRTRADTTAKAFGALATTAVAGIGFAKLGDVFPWEDGLWWPLSLAFVGLILMLLAVAFFTARLWGVAQPILTDSDPKKMEHLRGKEPQIVARVYDDYAAINRVRSLRAYAARGVRIARIADSRPDAADAPKLRARADAIMADVQAAGALAVALVVRRRSGRVVKSVWSAIFFAAFAIGAVTFAIASDKLESARSDEITLAKACAEARTAKAYELPPICGEPRPDDDATLALAKACADARTAGALESKLPASCGLKRSADPESQATAEATADAALTALVQARATCRATFRSAGGGTNPCVALDRAIREALDGT